MHSPAQVFREYSGLSAHQFLRDILASLRKNRGECLHVTRSGPGTAARMAQFLLAEGHSVVLVAQDGQALSELRSLLTLFSPVQSAHATNPARTQWERDFISLPQLPLGSGGRSLWAERMAALYSLANRKPAQGVIVTLDNFLLRLPPVSIFSDHELRLHKGMDMAPELVMDQAIDWGYTRSPMVSVPGEIALRGDILDIFCPGYIKPLRLDFFGDTLDDIRLFEPSSQRSVADCPEICVLPVAPVIASKTLSARAEAFWKKEIRAGRLPKEALQGLVRTLESNPDQLRSGIFYEESSILFDWLPPDAVYLLPDERACEEQLKVVGRGFGDLLEEDAARDGLVQPARHVLVPLADALNALGKSTRVSFDGLRIGGALNTVAEHPLPEKRHTDFQAVFPLQEAQERPWQYLVSLMKEWTASSAHRRGRAASEPAAYGQDFAPDEAKKSIFSRHLSAWFEDPVALPGDSGPAFGKLVLSFGTERSRERFLKLAEQDGLFPNLRLDAGENGVFALISPFRQGLSLGWDNTLVLGEEVLQPRLERAKRLPRTAFQGLDRYDELFKGDFLVHRDYGVGVFGGLERMSLGGVESDYLLLFYAGEDKLYLPVDRLSLIQKFKGADGVEPHADKLGGSLWLASKDKARRAIEKIAADLVEMYALRKVMKGFRYTPINEMYREFEATFGFEETPDQSRAIEEVLADMEKPEPMDRLVCGDVGFGKTEVALRAAFRAALEGRQVALLCPTTILAEQHYQTFRSRLSGFPVNVGLLSRFVPKPKQKEVLAAVAGGQIDILIGTHRLLSKDLVVPKLGLLILDEEQRFGVRHKERLKEIRKNVDALTLTATPIPRTLQLSLSGIRELSVIETPPPERKPVSTALIERDDATLRQIVAREIEREGQVFWVYNRVQGLERVAEYVKKLVPAARVGMAHGQMGEAILEKTMHDFWHGELDVLVCTSIIESGLDFPRANTLVVDQAQMFGLGQLYQLRGRVGRSDRQAFAVFVTPDPDKLQDPARQRMRIILDMDHLGAGFQVAMEDLRLRGAGNILGESQSGHMNRLGLDLFLEMLEEAVAKLRGERIETYVETELNLGVPALIPQEYMQESRERLRYYKLLSSAQDDASQQDIEMEMRDRFGVFPEVLLSFVAILRFKRKLTRWGVGRADILPEKVRLAFSDKCRLEPAALVDFVSKMREREREVRLHPPAVLELPLKGENVMESLGAIETVLHGLMSGEPHSC